MIKFSPALKEPSLRILLITLGLAVFAMSLILNSIDLFSQAIYSQSNQLLGADAIIESPHALPSELIKHASENLKVTQTIEFLSMLEKEKAYQLVSVRAIQGEFPLRGKHQPNGGNSNSPSIGKVWVVPEILAKLNAQIKENVTLGASSLQIGGILTYESLGLSEIQALAPRIYMHYQDLKNANVITPQSRATYSLWLTGESTQVQVFLNKVQQNYPQLKIITARQGQGSLARIYNLSQTYLILILLIQLILAAMAISIASFYYYQSQHNTFKIWKVLGALQGQIIRTFLTQLVILSFTVMIGGLSLSYGILEGVTLIKQFNLPLLKLHYLPGLTSMMMGFILILGFSLSQLVLSKKKVYESLLQLLIGIAGLCILYGVMLYHVNVKSLLNNLSLLMLLSFAISFLLTHLVWFLLNKIKLYFNWTWRFSLLHLLRQRTQGIIQCLTFSFIISCLLLVLIIQFDFIHLWRKQLPTDSPNYFLINIMPHQKIQIEHWLTQQKIKNIQFYPIIRGRLTQIAETSNDKVISREATIQRALNLTWVPNLPNDNLVVEGMNWDELKLKRAISVEKNFAKQQNLKLNDTLTFLIEQQTIRAKIGQIRQVSWESLKPNFYVIFPPTFLESYPFFYLTSFYLNDSSRNSLLEFSHQFPEVSIIAIGDIINKLKELLTKIGSGLIVLLILTFTFGILFMYASLLTTMKARFHESALMQLLGAPQSLIKTILYKEFILLGFICGTLGSGIAIGLAYYLAKSFLELDWHFTFKWILIGEVVAISFITLLGLLGVKKVFKVKPLWLLRQVSH